MKLVLKNNDGETVTIGIKKNETFAELRRRVEDESGILLDLKAIQLQGKKLEGDQKVLDYFIPQNQGLELLMKCIVPGCKNTKAQNPDKTFFRFPQEEIRCHQWALYCQRLSMMAGKHRLDINSDSTVCSDHFRNDQFVKNTTTLLKRTAVPCICPNLPVNDTVSMKRPHAITSRRPSRKFMPEENLMLDVSPNIHESASYKSDFKDVMLCRLCARPTNDFVFIFDEVGEELSLAEKISSCLPIVVKTTDHLPKQVCRECCEQLDQSYALAKVCVNADSKLKGLNNKQQHPPVESSEHSSPIKSTELSHDTISDTTTDKNITSDESLICPLCIEGTMMETCDLINSKHKKNFVIVENNTSLSPFTSSGCTTKYSNENDHEGSSKDSEILNGKRGSEESDEVIIISDSDKTDENCEKDEHYIFQCRVCGVDFPSSSEILQHSMTHYDDGFYHCSLCDNYYYSQDDLEAHLTEHDPLSNKVKEPCENELHCENCDLLFETNSLFRKHACVGSAANSTKCKVCSKIFRSEARLLFHMKFHAGAMPGYCDICQKTFPDEVKLYKHTLYLHATEKTHCCEECGKIFRSISSLKYHQRSHQGDEITKPYSCEQCGKCFMRKNMLRNHIISAHKNEVQETSCFSCKICNEAFPVTTAAVSHMDTYHKSECNENGTYSFEMHTVKRVYICEYCERCFIEGQHLNEHRDGKHGQDSPYQCKVCNEQFGTYGEYNGHKTSHGEKVQYPEHEGEFQVPVAYLCEYCDRNFISYIKFTEHLTVHYGPLPYNCRYCSLRFATLFEVTQHRLIHNDEPSADDMNYYRPYECHYCNKSFAIEDALVKHIRMHTGEKPFICDQCGKGFSQSSGLYTHQKVHSNERPYSCPLCTRTFKIKGDRDVHVRKHSGDRPYKCEFCGKAFMTQHVYSQHRKIHTGERPYKCDVCGIAFRRSHVLTVHKRIHTGEKPNVCDVCGKRYRQKGDMLKHRRIQHGDERLKKDQIQNKAIREGNLISVINIGNYKYQHFEYENNFC